MKRQSIQVGAYQAAYQRSGNGTPLIFLHGFLGSSDNWTPLWPDLSQHYQCIGLDLLGFGQSSKPKLRYTIWHQIEFLQAFITALQLREFHLIGHSYGGWLAAAYAIAAAGMTWQPDKTGWAIANPTDQFNQSADQSTEATGQPPKRPIPPPKSLTLLAPAGIRDDQFVGRYNYMKPLLWDSPVIDWLMAGIRPIARLTGKANAFRQIDLARTELRAQPVAKSFIVDRLRPEDAIDTVEQWLDQISQPTVVIAGQQDTTIPKWHCETYASQIHGAHFHCFDDADHDLVQTHHRQIAPLIRAQLSHRLED